MWVLYAMHSNHDSPPKLNTKMKNLATSVFLVNVLQSLVSGSWGRIINNSGLRCLRSKLPLADLGGAL